MAECRGDQGGELGEEAKDRSGRRGAAKYIPAGCAVAAFNKLASNKEGTESQEITIEVKSKTKQWGKKTHEEYNHQCAGALKKNRAWVITCKKNK